MTEPTPRPLIEPWPTEWLNVRDYDPLALWIYFIGGAFWLVNYALLIQHSFRVRRIEMPVFVAAGNFAWELCWTIFFHPAIGLLCAIGYAMAFALDVVIFFNVLRFGHTQVATPFVRRHFKPLCLANFAVWLVLCYAFRVTGYDDDLGFTSAYILNLFISIQGAQLYFSSADPHRHSTAFTWTRGVGTGLMTVSSFWFFPTNHFIHAAGLVCLAVDGALLALMLARRAAAVPHSEAVAPATA